MNKVLTRGIITIAAVNDGKDGHSLTAKAFIEGSYRNGRTKGVKSYVKVFYDGQEVKDFTVSYRYKGAGQADWVKPQTNKEDSWSDAQRDGSTLFVEYVVEYKGLISVTTGRLDNIQDGEDAVGYALVPLEEKVVAYLTDDKGKLVDVELMYKVRKSVGERVSFVTDLAAEGMTLEVSGGLGDFGADGERFFILESVLYEDNYDSYAVTLTKGGNVVDRRVLPITFKPKVVFDIDTKNGKIRSDISTLDGRVSGFETTIDHFRTEVKDKVSHSELKQTAEGIEMKVGSSVNANLLWGSDLDLSGVQDVMKRAYELGNSIKKKTEEKAEWKRSRDNAGSDDDRMRYQEGMDDCDREIAQAQGEVAKCKEAIAKHLGVGLNATKVDNTEWFEFLKGGGVGGADAIKAKVAVVNGEGNYYAGLYWQIGFGAKSNVKVKPKTKYTFSFWIRTEILQGSGYAVAESINMESLTGGRKDRAMPWTDVKATNEWERMSYTFTTGDTGYIMVGVGLSGKNDFSGLIYLCHPKLEEGEVATPWCAYDGTVDALLAGGFDITEKKFTVTEDNFMVRNNRGEQTFMVDKNGKINTKMLNTLWFYRTFVEINDSNFREYMTYVNGIFRPEVRGSYAFYWVNVAKTGPSMTFNITSKSRHENTNFYPAPRIYLNYLSYMPKRNMVPGVLDNILLLGSEMVIENKGDIAVSVVGSLCFSGYGFPSLAYHGNGYNGDEQEERRHYYQPLMISIDKGEVAHLRCRLIGDRTNVKIGWEYAVGKVSRWNDAISYHPYYQPSNLTDMADGNYPVNSHGEEFAE